MSEALPVLLPLPQHQPGEARPCGPSGRPLAGSIPTQPAGPLLFLPFAAALLPPLGRTRCSVARLFIPIEFPVGCKSEIRAAFRCIVQKCTQATKRTSARGWRRAEVLCRHHVLEARDPEGSTYLRPFGSRRLSRFFLKIANAGVTPPVGVPCWPFIRRRRSAPVIPTPDLLLHFQLIPKGI